jgi:uncharacterized protein involved in exopolysaccharide biosynthesis
MHEEGQARWDPENDPEYSQRLLPYLARRYFAWLVWGTLFGAIGFAVFALFQPSSYSTSGTLKISKTSGGGGLLAGVPQLLSGKANSALLDEMQIITSRDLGLPVIGETGLQVDIYDPGGPDGALGRMRSLFNPGQVATVREERYTRLTVSDIRVSDELLKEAKFWITADGQGNWRANGKQGANGQTADFGSFSFTPHFGAAHRAGDRYHIVVKTNWQAWKDYRSALGVRPATEESSIVSIAFSHRNPYVAQRVVNRLIERYLQRNRETTYGGFDVMLQFVADEAVRSERKMQQATDELRRYQEQNEIYAPDAQGQAAAKEIADLSAAQTGTKIQLRQAQSVLNLLKTRTPEEVYTAIQAPGVAGALEGESDELAGLVKQLLVERQTKTEAHPDVQALESRIKTAVAQLQRATQSQIDKLEVSNRQYEADIGKLVGQLSRLPAATGKLALLDAQIQSEVEVQKLLKQQEAQTKLSRAGTTSEVRLIDAPPVPFERDSPRLGRSFVLGAVAGGFAMILFALVTDASRRGFRSLRDLRMTAGLPVLGVLPGRPVTGRWRPANGALPGGGLLSQWLLDSRRSLGIVHLGGMRASYDLAWSIACERADVARPAVLLDLDRLSGTLRGVWQLPDRPGLSELASGAAQPEALLHKVREGVALLPPGARTLSAEDYAKAWLALSERSGAVLCCLPPPAQWQDQARLLPLLDSVVLCVPQGGVTASAAGLAVAQLRQLGVEPAGIVVTNYSPVRDALGTADLGLLAVEPEGVR